MLSTTGETTNFQYMIKSEGSDMAPRDWLSKRLLEPLRSCPIRAETKGRGVWELVNLPRLFP